MQFDVKRVIAAGFTGREKEAVRKHPGELRAHGVPGPERARVDGRRNLSLSCEYRVTPIAWVKE